MRLLFLILAALIATPAAAQTTMPIAPPSGPGAPQPTASLVAEPVALMIAGFDGDGDARVTRAEFDAGLKHAFDSADPTRKGSVGYIGFSDWAERWLGNRNALPSPFEVDRDGDNRITFDELAIRFDLFFMRFDVNKDGVIVRSELVMLRPQMLLRGRGGHGEGGELRRPTP